MKTSEERPTATKIMNKKNVWEKVRKHMPKGGGKVDSSSLVSMLVPFCDGDRKMAKRIIQRFVYRKYVVSHQNGVGITVAYSVNDKHVPDCGRTQGPRGLHRSPTEWEDHDLAEFIQTYPDLARKIAKQLKK